MSVIESMNEFGGPCARQHTATSIAARRAWVKARPCGPDRNAKPKLGHSRWQQGNGSTEGRRHACCVGLQRVNPGGAFEHGRTLFSRFAVCGAYLHSLAHSTKGRTHCLATSHRPGTSSKLAMSGTTKSGLNSTMDAKAWSISRMSCTVNSVRFFAT